MGTMPEVTQGGGGLLKKRKQNIFCYLVSFFQQFYLQVIYTCSLLPCCFFQSIFYFKTYYSWFFLVGSSANSHSIDESFVYSSSVYSFHLLITHSFSTSSLFVLLLSMPVLIIGLPVISLISWNNSLVLLTRKCVKMEYRQRHQPDCCVQTSPEQIDEDERR